MGKVLVVIDVQLGMFQWIKEPYRGEELLNRIEGLLERARAKGIPVVYVQHTDDDDDDVLGCGQPGWHIHPRIAPKEGDKVVHKRVPDSFHETDLLETLQEYQAEELIVAGMQTEFCVDTTLRRAFSLGFKATVASDAHSTFDSDTLPAELIVKHHEGIWNGRFATLRKSEEIDFG